MTPADDLFGSRSRPVLLDGGLSTALERAGHDLTGALWTARVLADDPDAVVAAHESYLRAGAEVVITASYQASVEGFVAEGMDAHTARALIVRSTDLARRAVARVDGPTRRFVAASVGPFGATLHDGSEYHGRYDADWAHVRRFHRERLSILVDSGPDLLAVETIPSLAEAEIIVDEAERAGSLPLWVSFSCADDVATCHGEVFADAAARVASHDNVIAVGVNCTAPEHVRGLLRALGPVADHAGVRTLAYPNHGGRWDGVEWHGTTPLDVDHDVVAWLDAGVGLMGGCCGVGPSEVAAMGRTLASWSADRPG